jgi:hypothetical protein
VCLDWDQGDDDVKGCVAEETYGIASSFQGIYLCTSECRGGYAFDAVPELATGMEKKKGELGFEVTAVWGEDNEKRFRRR